MRTAISRTVAELQAIGGLKQTDIADFVGVAPPVVACWADDQALPPAKAQISLAHLRFVIDCLSDLYTPSEVRSWLYARHPLLDESRPVDLLRNKRIGDVIAVTERMDKGAHI